MYAYRENMTDVVIKDLLNDKKCLVKCDEYVKKIAVYRNALAVQLPDKMHIYELSIENDELKCNYLCKIAKQLDCNVLVVTSKNVILCQVLCLL